MTYSRDDLVAYRLKRSQEALEEAEAMADMAHWHTCVSRLYYACFYAVTALLIRHDLAPSKHTGVRAFFNNQFVAKGAIPREQGKLYNLLFKYRQQSDYEDFFSIDEHIVKQWIEETKGFLRVINEYIEKVS